VTGGTRPASARLGLAIATCGYIGFVPVAPGTFGSAAGLALFLLLAHAGSSLLYVAVAALLFLLGVWGGSVAERELGRTDPGPVVMDEVVGMLITLAFLDVTLTGAVVGFLVFRLLDVVKPWPSRRFEQLHGGLGVMADDAMAAVYGNVVMRILLWLAPAGWLAS
jgi:phosphatidylglycerophosphatase A